MTSHQLKPVVDESACISCASTQVADPITPAWGRRFNSDSHANSPWARKTILSLDGGGIRGYASLLILKALMSRLEDLERKSDKHDSNYSSSEYPWLAEKQGTDAPSVEINSGFKPQHYFDYLAGTSTGGLTVVMLGRLQMTVDKAIEQYDIVGKQVFGKPRKFAFMGLGRTRYSASTMDDALQNAMLEGIAPEVERSTRAKPPYPRVGAQILNKSALSAETRLHIEQLKSIAQHYHFRNENEDASRSIVVSHGGKISREAYLFRSYDHPAPSASDKNRRLHLNHGPATDATIWQAARATSAAPGYFPRVELPIGTFEDGGLGENNPVSLAYEEVKQMHMRREPLLILSIGTGVANAEHWKDDIPIRPLKQLVRMWREIENLQKQITDSEKTHERFDRFVRDHNQKSHEQIHYFRFNVPDISSIRLDEWQPSSTGQITKDKMSEAVNNYVKDISAELDKCAGILYSLRRERAQTERWERFALHLKYCCREKDCESVVFNSRKALRKHASDYHGFVWRIGCHDAHHGAQASVFTCIWDHCGEQKVSIFNSEELFEKHLREHHGYLKPKIMDNDDFERWLDRGRMTRDEATSRSATLHDG